MFCRLTCFLPGPIASSRLAGKDDAGVEVPHKGKALARLPELRPCEAVEVRVALDGLHQVAGGGRPKLHEVGSCGHLHICPVRVAILRVAQRKRSDMRASCRGRGSCSGHLHIRPVRVAILGVAQRQRSNIYVVLAPTSP